MTETKTAPVAPRQVAGDELRAQYLACSYLVSACEQALARMASLNRASAGRSYVPQRALELIEAIGEDWRTALQDVGRLMAREA